MTYVLKGVCSVHRICCIVTREFVCVSLCGSEFVSVVDGARILVSIVVSIPACHAGDPGSIPGREAFGATCSLYAHHMLIACSSHARYMLVTCLLHVIPCSLSLIAARACYSMRVLVMLVTRC